MDDIDWMDVKEKDDTIRELRQKLAEAEQRIAELTQYNKELAVNDMAKTERIAELEISEEKYRLHAMNLEEDRDAWIKTVNLLKGV